MSEFSEDDEIVSCDDFYLPFDDAEMVITDYHPFVYKNFHKGLPIDAESLEKSFRFQENCDLQITRLAGKFLKTFTSYDMPLTGMTEPLAALALNLLMLQELLLHALRNRVVFKAIVAAPHDNIFPKYFPQWRFACDFFKDANMFIATGIERHFKGLCDQNSAWMILDLGLLIGKVILRARSATSELILDLQDAAERLTGGSSILEGRSY